MGSYHSDLESLTRLGVGGFGIVYRDERGGVPVAVKVARGDRRDAAARLLREGEILAAIGPPHVPALMERGRLDDGTPYLVMELVTAPSLEAQLAGGERPPLDVPARALLNALAAVHARGIAHRDLKPGNVLWDGAGRARLIDFGLARRIGVDAALTAEGELVGTPEYMAPERCEGRPADQRADVYAAGIILYELVAGRPPFQGSPADVQHAHRHRRPARPSTLAPVPAAIEDVVMRCLAKDPERRPADAHALLLALEAALRADASAGAPLSPPSVAEGGRTRDRRRVVVLLAAGADVFAVQEIAARAGGRLAYAGEQRCAVVVDHDAGDAPAARAVSAAETMLARRACARILVDVRRVAVQVRADGSRRYHDRTFADPLAYPRDDPKAQALVITEAARELLPDRGIELIGRDAMIDALVATARRAFAGLPAVAAVLGEPGLGKSHLARELCRILGDEADVIDLRVRDDPDADPDDTLRELLRAALVLPALRPGDGGEALLAERLGRGAAPAVAAVAHALGWHDGDGPEMRQLAAAPGALRAAAARAAADGLRRLAAGRPLAVLIDDAQRADDATLDALELATMAEHAAPIFVLALGRPSFSAARPEWGERAGLRLVETLGPLDPTPAAELCRRLLLPAEDVPDAAVELLTGRAQGSPLYLVELVRSLKRRGLVRPHARGHGSYLAADEVDTLSELPVVTWASARELAGLPVDLAAHARLAALLGPELEAAEMDGVIARLEAEGDSDAYPLDAGVALARLTAAGLLVRDRRDRLVFRHALVRDAVAQLVPGMERRRIHAAAYEHHRGRGEGPRDDRDLAQLSRHAAAAGLVGIAAAGHLRLAERARARHAYVEAEALYSRALDGEATREAHRGRGLMRYRIGRYDDALADLEAARALAAGDDAAVADILLDEATVLDWTEDYRRSRAAVEEAARLGAASRPLQAARLLLGQGRSAHRFSRTAEARELLQAAAAGAAELGDEGYETWAIAMLMLGFVLPSLGDLDGGEAALARVIAECRARGDRVHLFSALNNRALIMGYRGAPGELVAELQAIRGLARELGQVTMQLVAEFNLGEFLYLMGETAAAEAHVRRAVELERRRHGDAARPFVALLDARLRLALGDEAGARAVLDEVGRLLAGAQQSGAAETLLVPSEEVLADMLALALRGGAATAEEWAALEARAARDSVGQERIEVHEVHARAALAAGRPDEARAALAQALALAERVPNVMSARLARLAGRLDGQPLAT